MRLRTPEKMKERHRKAQFKLKAHSSRSARSDIQEEEDLYAEEEGNSMKLSHAFFVVLILHIFLIGGIFGFNYMKARQIAPISSAQASGSMSSAVEAPRAVSSPEAKSSAGVMTPANPQASSLSLPSSTREENPQMQAGAQSALGPNNNHRLKNYSSLEVPPQIAAPVVSANPAGSSAIRGNTTPSIAGAASPLKPLSSPELHSLKASIKKDGHPSSSGSRTQPKIYVVVAGDNPYAIARKFKINYVQLLSANHIEDPTKLQIGTKLKIPVKDQ